MTAGKVHVQAPVEKKLKIAEDAVVQVVSRRSRRRGNIQSTEAVTNQDKPEQTESKIVED
jgi:hypothetical protein